MLTKTYSITLQGIDALPVEIEVNATEQGDKTQVTIVGLPDTAIRESRDRVFSAINSSGFFYPCGYTIINLAPADLKKEGTCFDLPIAIGLITINNDIPKEQLADKLFVGELALDGTVRPCHGAVSMALLAKERGFNYLIVPKENAPEAAIVKGVKVIGVESLRETVDWLKGKNRIDPTFNDFETYVTNPERDIDFLDIKGQELVKRALEVAAAGGHNVLMIGSPGTGKSMCASRLPTILPPMSIDEALETSRIHSVTGLIKSNGISNQRPFRSPHHSISDAGLLGGHSNPRPGEISLSHNGVLFLDELPEFKRTVLEAMRQPLETAEVTISRASSSVTFPANFQLIAAMNPCPCGYLTDRKRRCRCSTFQITRYRNRISGPLLDRIDIHVEVNAISDKELLSKPSGETSEAIRERVINARKIQNERFKDNSRIFSNSNMNSKSIREFCIMEEDCSRLLKSAIHSLNLSARAYDRILKLARTLADMEATEKIQSQHISEAIQYRSLDRQLW